MDLLADILRISGLRKRILHRFALSQPWALRFPCPHSMGFHVVTQGEAYLWTEGSVEPVLLRCGDMALMSRGSHHHVSTHADRALVSQALDVSLHPSSALPDSASPLATWVSGAYQLWHDPIHPLFQELPAVLILRAETLAYADSMPQCLQVLAHELRQPALGSEAVVVSLLDILFHLMLRRVLVGHTGRSAQWARATQDPQMGAALQLMHAEPAREWSLESLAAAVGLSRSGFALKFKQSVGETPLQYLTTLRMLLAMEQLSQTDETLERIARQVGYHDAFGFSKAFKKAFGLSPRAFRQKDAAEQKLAWRFS
ncbi:MAG: cupin domain-containing protein [Candidatus Sericytochromatia bacterium]